MCYGSAAIEGNGSKVLVRFRNTGGRKYLRAEAHVIYKARSQDRTKVTFHWTDSLGAHTESRVMGGEAWQLATAKNVKTRWVEMEPVPR
jgi:hypothetical protein